MGDHTESLQVDFDPNVVSLEQLVDLFWRSHSPIHGGRSRQYMSAIWFANEQQQTVMNVAKMARGEELSAPIQTPVLPLDTFYLAEDYHQKYRLQQNSALMQLFNALYPKFSDFNDSTAAARLNGDRLQKAEKMSDQELAEYGILGDAMKLAAGGGGWVGNCSI